MTINIIEKHIDLSLLTTLSDQSSLSQHFKTWNQERK